MFIRACYRRKNGKRHAYWALVETYRTDCGVRQRVVSYIGAVEQSVCRGVKRAAGGEITTTTLFENTPAEWVEIDANGVRVENPLDFGGAWLGHELLLLTGLDKFLSRIMPSGYEDVPWKSMAEILLLSRLCEPSSELHIEEQLYRTTAMQDITGVPAEKVNHQRLYRALDKLLPHKEELETFLKTSLGSLFSIEYDLLLYDVTSTYFEGKVENNELAKRGYSRDQRGDCKQVCIGLVVTREGLPLGYQVFAGNRHDSTTVREVVERMEKCYGKAGRIWVMDRGMASPLNDEFLQEGRQYIIGTPKAALKNYEKELLSADWQVVREGLEVKLVPAPQSKEMFILCRSRDRRLKEQAIHEKFIGRMEEGLQKISDGCAKRKCSVQVASERVGRLKQKNSRAGGLFAVEIHEDEAHRASLSWHRKSEWEDWATLSEGCYMLRTNITNWNPEDLWRAYIQLTEAEEAFRIAKNDLNIHPIWHQNTERVNAHILICFLAFVLWKTLEKLCSQAGLGNEPRRVFAELAKIKVVDVVLPTKQGNEIRKRCISQPTDHQAILLSRLNLQLPKKISLIKM